MNDFLRFLERHLGTIQYGWSKDGDGNKLPFQIVKYSNGHPFSGTTTYSTLGLSNDTLISPVSGKQIRQELVFVSDSTFGDKNIPGIIQQVGLKALHNKMAYLRGDVIGPYGSLFDNSRLEALNVTVPVYFPEAFHTFFDNENTPIVMSWLVPITLEEANFVRLIGWDKFEDKLEEINPDLIDFNRKGLL
ncbi:suppressor of fused domain protein [Paenibacillus planticolens]|uniref:Suppressor of fused domain protein n=1 Tax=Paenibacillus planticolens TaxID=2654976 RepID=A0ABX1ZIW7_9BACL|nr:suppressor of fused domain protein [Paenibacillus planticolens]NOV00032.1 suppressor of fused domain protein [Paenibacillus planticolens]